MTAGGLASKPHDIARAPQSTLSFVVRRAHQRTRSQLLINYLIINSIASRIPRGPGN